MANQVFDSFKTGLLDGSVDLLTDTIKVLLLSGANDTVTTSASSLSYVLSSDVNETSGIGYTAGGQTINNMVVSSTSDSIFIDADDVTWSSSTITAGGAIVYKDSDIPLFYVDFAANRSSYNGNFTIQWLDDGILEVES